MSPRLVSLAEAAETLAGAVERRWADAICGELAGAAPTEFGCALSPGVSSGAAVERLGADRWHR